MSALTQVLRDADPLRDDPPAAAHAHRITRQAIVDMARDSVNVPDRRRVLSAVTVAVVVAGAAVGLRVWPLASVNVAAAAVRFEVRPAEERPASGLDDAAVGRSGTHVYLQKDPIVTNQDVSSATVVGGGDGTFGVEVHFTAASADKMRRATADHIGKPLAILIDGHVAAAPMVRDSVSGVALISGDFTRAEAERIVAGIRGR